ncbi:hypothetical protein ACIHFE_19965 [Streptomyces sp. NPDC052396]|uniref:hypothetical protein n=1 Tax=Streptomyces sp. NPDC052396 TaxID=3365689 RepID=UPI0037D25B0E
MTNGADDTVVCLNPRCSNPVAPSSGSGRPRKYCSDRCRGAFHRTGAGRPTPTRERHDGYVHQLLGELLEKIDSLHLFAHADRTELTEPSLLHWHSLALLRGAEGIRKDLQDLDAAIVQQARDRGVRVVEIAEARNVSPDKVRRDWPEGGIDRRMLQRPVRPRLPRRTTAPLEQASPHCTYLPGRYLPGEAPRSLPEYGHDATEGPPGAPPAAAA